MYVKKESFYLFLLLVLALNQRSIGQIAITFPSDRVVFQRDNANKATLSIAGHFAGCADRIEARFVPRASGQGTQAPAGGGWATIQNNPSGGNFYGTMPVNGGWYKLEVRAILDNAVVAAHVVEHVGVGEVFVVAGQSNATGGDANANGPGAADDRVNSVHFQNLNADGYPGIAPYSAVRLPCPQYVHLDAGTKTSPFGNYAWCWGAFGDSLVKKLQVPVMIFNTGWSSTGIRNWQETINSDQITTSEFGYVFPTGLPFGHLKLALNNYVAQLGIRAVLWHQGETDNLANRTAPDYLKDIREVIQATRGLSGKSKLAWVVSRVSRFTVAGSSRIWQPVIDAQNDVIGLGSHGADPAYKLPDVFAGPETDGYWDSKYRSDQVHFAGAGLLHLAGWWTEKLNKDFFDQSTPYPAIPPPQISTLRSETSGVTFQAPGGWASYNWLSPGDCHNILSNQAQRSASSGDYRLKVVDHFNNTVFSPTLRVPAALAPSAIARNSDQIQQTIHSGDNYLMASDCRIIAKVVPATAALLNTNLTLTALIDGSVNKYQNIPYLQRHFDLGINASNTAPSYSLTLFFPQSEFNVFNASSTVPLPVNPTDQTGKNHLRIIQFQGTSADGSLGSYNGSRTEIVPASVTWNTALTSWEVTFNVTGTGGFFISTINNALPVTLTYLSGKVSVNTAALEWETSMEENASHFEVERSDDAVAFEPVAKITAVGNSKSIQRYTHQDAGLKPGIYYYRLKQIDLDGSYEHSRIIGLKVRAGTSVKIFPNPVAEQISISSEIEINSVELIHSTGAKLLSAFPDSHSYFIEMEKYPTGLYLLVVNGETYKIVKK